MTAIAEAVEARHAFVVAADRLAVDDAGARPQAEQRLNDEREAISQAVAGAAVEPDAVAVLAGDDEEAVVLDLVNPHVPGWRLRGFGSQAWRDEANGQGHSPPIERWRGARQTRGSRKDALPAPVFTPIAPGCQFVSRCVKDITRRVRPAAMIVGNRFMDGRGSWPIYSREILSSA
jgi:hypothetical protein